MSNTPETIEINGLKTIHKLCKFGADYSMEGCSFTEIVERIFAELEKYKVQAVPEGYVLFPKVVTNEISEILGMQCFQFIRTAQIYRELGFEIKNKAESEQAFFLFKFLHLALIHGDKYLDVFNAETRKLIEVRKSGTQQ